MRIAAHLIIWILVILPLGIGVVTHKFGSARRRSSTCRHELVETGKAGAGSVYRCRLCGAVLYDKAATQPITLKWNWILGLAFLGISSSIFLGEALPAMRDGKLYDSPIRRAEFPFSYWGFLILFLGVSAASIAVSVWQFCSALRKMKAMRNAA